MTEQSLNPTETGLQIAHPRIDLQVTLSRVMIATRGSFIY